MNTFEFEITIQSKSGDDSWPIVIRCKQPDSLTINANWVNKNLVDFNSFPEIISVQQIVKVDAEQNFWEFFKNRLSLRNRESLS